MMKKLMFSLVVILFSFNIALACINDASSRYFESQPFPTEMELIKGSYHIHSSEFYEWRIKDREKKLLKNPKDPALLDDLAVSYEKTGQTQKAIDLLQSNLNNYPDRYETLSNLGTFYIHHKEYEKGLGLLKKAIKINPQAHYGREIYQIKAVEYLLSLKKTDFSFPLQKDSNFADFVLSGIKQSDQKDELIRAIVGVSGMLKFGNADSPILLELLGDLYSRISTNYLSQYQSYVINSIKSVATNFYFAAYANSKNPNSMNEFIKSKPQIFDPEIIARAGARNIINKNGLENYINESLSTINTYKEEGLLKRKKSFNQEKEIIKNSTSPEQDIFDKVIKSTNNAPDSLFEDKKEAINKMIKTDKIVFIESIVDEFLEVIYLAMGGIFLLSTLISTYYINVINFKFIKELPHLDEIQTHIKNSMIIYNLLILISILLIIFQNPVTFTMFTVVGVIFFINSFFINKAVKVFNKENKSNNIRFLPTIRLGLALNSLMVVYFFLLLLFLSTLLGMFGIDINFLLKIF